MCIGILGAWTLCLVFKVAVKPGSYNRSQMNHWGKAGLLTEPWRSEIIQMRALRLSTILNNFNSFLV